MINAFDVIKETLKIADVLAFYGVVMKRGNKALCPIHNEKTPSFTVYPNTNSWHCFGCGVGGSVIDFVMAYFGLDALEAAKKLGIDFNLGVFDNNPSQEEMNRQYEQRTQIQAYKSLSTTFDDYISKSYSLLCEYLYLLKDWKNIYAPQSLEELESLNQLYVESCCQLNYIEYLIEGLSNASYGEQISFYQTHRKEMTKIAERIKRNTKGTNADKST